MTARFSPTHDTCFHCSSSFLTSVFCLPLHGQHTSRSLALAGAQEIIYRMTKGPTEQSVVTAHWGTGESRGEVLHVREKYVAPCSQPIKMSSEELSSQAPGVPDRAQSLPVTASGFAFKYVKLKIRRLNALAGFPALRSHTRLVATMPNGTGVAQISVIINLRVQEDMTSARVCDVPEALCLATEGDISRSKQGHAQREQQGGGPGFGAILSGFSSQPCDLGHVT